MPGDAWPENDHGSATWAGTGELRTLIVGDRRPANLAGDFLPTERFTQGAAQLAAEGWQVIVLSDVPAEASRRGADALVGQSDAGSVLSPNAARALESFVRDNGGGLVLLASAHAFGPGRYGEGSIAGDVLEGSRR